MAASELGATPTHCPRCSLQCGMTVAVGPEASGVLPGRDAGAGGLCPQGRAAREAPDAVDRVTVPLMRVHPGAPLEPVSWDAALDAVAARILAAQAAHGDDAVAVLGGGGLTNERAYQLGKFARIALRTAQFDHGGRLLPSDAALSRAFGLDRGLPGPIADLGRADALLLVGGAAAEAMPPLVRHLDRLRENGGALIVADPRRTAVARRADLHLQLTPGTEPVLANGMLRLAMAEGLLEESYIAARTSGFERLRAAVDGYWPELVERITGVPVAHLREAVRRLAAAGRSLILTAQGPERPERDADTATAFINLALALGLPGTEGSGYGCVTAPGERGDGGEHGQKADRLPGHRRLEDPDARAYVASVWGVHPELIPGPGRPARELLASLGARGGPRALLLFGCDPVVSAPRASVVEERLNALDLLVVADSVLSETARRADVVLPTARWSEESGTVTNLEGRVLRRRRAAALPEGVRTDLEVIGGLAGRLSAPGVWSADPEEVFAELARASAGGIADYSGITYERIDREGGVFWPCPSPEHPGTPWPFLDRFATADGRARFVTVERPGPEEEVDTEFPFYLSTGRPASSPREGGRPARAGAEPFVELHPDLAGRLGIEPGALVRVTGRRGVSIARARLSDDLRGDTVFMEPDQAPGAPESEVCAVRVEAAGGPPGPPEGL